MFVIKDTSGVNDTTVVDREAFSYVSLIIK